MYERVLEYESRLASLETKIDNLASDLTSIKGSLDAFTSKLVSLSLLEERQMGHTKEYEKTMKRLHCLEREFTTFKKEQEKKHDLYSRWAYTVSGVILAVSVLWSVFGSYITSNIEKSLSRLDEIYLIIQQGRQPDSKEQGVIGSNPDTWRSNTR